jgi:predicted O-linked N-acetylglucosamine transferase (SPINDLY family)
MPPGEPDADAIQRTLSFLANGGDPERAIGLLEQAVAARPGCASQRHNLGVAYGLAGRWQDAMGAFAACLSLDANHRESRASYAASLLECGHLEEALDQAHQALATSANSAFLHRTLGRIYAATGQPSEAAQSFHECLRLHPDNPRSLETAGDFFRENGEPGIAAQLFARLSELMPESVGAWSKSGGAYMRAGFLEPALAAYRKALFLAPDNSQLHSVLLYASVMSPLESGEDLLTAHRQWQTRLTGLGPEKPFSNSPDPERRLRIGILTGEFRSGSANFFLPPVVASHDSANFELFAYSANPDRDAQTERYIRLFRHWRDVAALSDAEVEAAIRADQIDILLDVSGHLKHRRLSVFARRAAPIQIAYPRYPCTTGLDAMDYRITDEWADPPGETEHHYCEKLLRLPSGYLAYEPPLYAPPVSSLPALANGYVTFGFFQPPLKLNGGVYDALAKTLLRVPGSRLLFQYAIGDFDCPGRPARQRIEDEMVSRGVDADRLLFRGPVELPERLAIVAETDIALDSFPYSGQTNTCECLWMGVPVVTLAGSRFSARVSAAILYRAGLGDWVGESEKEYSEIAVAKSSDLAALAELRRTLRNRFAASPVADGVRVTREIEAAYRTAWRDWCVRQEAPAFPACDT